MLYIRADMNHMVATGHMMRCLSIADAAREQGEDAAFLLADRQAVPLLAQRGYGAIVLDSPWDDMEAELPALEEVIRGREIRKILIDSYRVTPGYLEKVSQMAYTVYIDDLDRFSYPVDALVYYAADWESHCYSQRYGETKLLLGPSYTPLRKAFQGCREKEIAPQAESLLLLSGGTDPYGMLDKLLEEIRIGDYRRIEVICGMYDSQEMGLRRKYGNCGNVHFYKAVADMEAHMAHADLAVAAGGTTLYELCALGVPAISYSMADNQLPNVGWFHKNAVIDYAGDVRFTDAAGEACRLLEQYHGDARLRQERSRRMQKLIDGKGAFRIAAEIMGC